MVYNNELNLYLVPVLRVYGLHGASQIIMNKRTTNLGSATKKTKTYWNKDYGEVKKESFT